jgi:MFS transporter, DHA2 family, multidrug resistance protein
VQATMLMIGIKASRYDWSELRNADWLGIAGLVLGLGGMTTLLEEGHREQWFDSPLIWRLAAVSIIGFALVAAGQLNGKRRPVVRLALLKNRALSSAVVLLATLGMLLYTSIFITPQFLVSIAGYTSLQAGEMMFLSGCISIPVAFLYTVLIAHFDMRAIVIFAILSSSLANFMISDLTIASTGTDFIASQLLFGVGTTLSAIPLQQAVISSVPPEDAAEANALSSVSRNLGGSLGLAGLASFQASRFDTHYWQIQSSLPANDPALQDSLAQSGSLFGTGPEAMDAALRMLDGEIMRQALTMSFNDIYLIFGGIALATIPLVAFLRPPPKDAVQGPMH